jgi:hypothetical protein
MNSHWLSESICGKRIVSLCRILFLCVTVTYITVTDGRPASTTETNSHSTSNNSKNSNSTSSSSDTSNSSSRSNNDSSCSSNGSSNSSSSSSSSGSSSGGDTDTMAIKPDPSIAAAQQLLQRKFARDIRKFKETSGPQLQRKLTDAGAPTEQLTKLKRLIDRTDKHYGRLSRSQSTADQLAKWQLQQKLPSLLHEIQELMTEHSSGSSRDRASTNTTNSSNSTTGKMPCHT